MKINNPDQPIPEDNPNHRQQGSMFEILKKLNLEEKEKLRNTAPIICIDEFVEGEICGS